MRCLSSLALLLVVSTVLMMFHQDVEGGYAKNGNYPVRTKPNLYVKCQGGDPDMMDCSPAKYDDTKKLCATGAEGKRMPGNDYEAYYVERYKAPNAGPDNRCTDQDVSTW